MKENRMKKPTPRKTPGPKKNPVTRRPEIGIAADQDHHRNLCLCPFLPQKVVRFPRLPGGQENDRGRIDQNQGVEAEHDAVVKEVKPGVAVDDENVTERLEEGVEVVAAVGSEGTEEIEVEEAPSEKTA